MEKRKKLHGEATKLLRFGEPSAPLLVKTGVSTWNARRVPVGSRFAKLIVPVSALLDRELEAGVRLGVLLSSAPSAIIEMPLLLIASWLHH